MTPQISIITPLFRSGRTVERCMESVRASADAAGVRVEHVLVLDGPDAGTRVRIDAWDPGARVAVALSEEPHSGIAATRNAGLARATADTVTFLDADDEMTPQRLRVVTRGVPTVAIVGIQQVRGFEGDVVPGIWAPRQGGGGPLHYLTSIVLPTAWARDLGGFDPAYRVGDDWDFAIRLTDAGHPITYCDEVFVIRHVTQDNASHDTAALASDFIRGVRSHHRGRR